MQSVLTSLRRFFVGSPIGKILGGLLILVLIGTSFLAVNTLQQEQNLRQEAAAPTVCSIGQPTDTMLIIDKSGSMDDPTSATDPTPRIQRVKQAANAFVDLMEQDNDPSKPNHLIGVASISNVSDPQGFSRLEQPLTQFYNNVKTSINGLTVWGFTCIDCAVNIANQELLDSGRGRGGVKNVAILLTDGGATHMMTATSPPVPSAQAEAAAMNKVIEGYQQSGTVFYTIGFGTDVREQFLKDVAEATGGKYYFAPNANGLQAIFQSISTEIGKGAVNGIVFNDANGNGVFDSSESRLSGRTVQLKQGTALTGSMTTNTQGEYSFTGLCDGGYSVTSVAPSGWQQTKPTGNQGYTITIASGNSIIDRDFGFRLNPPTATPTKAPTATPTRVPTSTPLPTNTPIPQATKLSFTVFLHGIGNSGDSANPTAHSLSNKNPVHPQRLVDVEIFNAQNQKIADSTGIVIYNPAQGNFKGIIDMGTTVPSGPYTIKIKPDIYLRRLIPGIHTLTAGQTYTVPTVDLVAGDSNNDNALNILDYNLILNCYSDLGPAKSCTADQKLISDINDDGKVNQFDYNLFLRELSVQTGE